MKILLINPRTFAGETFSIPHGLLHLHAALKSAGHECDILDCCAEATGPEPSRLAGYGIIGLSAMSTQLAHAAEIARSAPPGSRVVWGGAHALIDPLSILNSFPSHFAVSGDGEKPLLDLLSHLERGPGSRPDYPGISFSGGEAVAASPFIAPEIESLPDIDYHALPRLESYIPKYCYFFHREFPTLRIVTSRGCSWNCSFCIHSTVRGQKHRSKSIAKIRRETEGIIDEFKVRVVYPEDDDFFANLKLASDFADYAADKGFYWSANCRFDYIAKDRLNPDMLHSLAERGLFMLSMSLEAGSETARNGILCKGLPDEKIRAAAEILRAAGGLKPIVFSSIIINFPGDSAQNRFDNIRWMESLSKKFNIMFHGPRNFMDMPGTKLYTAAHSDPPGDLELHTSRIAALFVELDSREKTLRDYFHTDFLPNHYNRRMKFFRPLEGCRYEIAPPPEAPAFKRAWDSFKRVFFLPVRLRMATGIRAAFVEPALFRAAKLAASRLLAPLKNPR